jgi:CRISPR-associated protein Csx10
MDNGKADSIVDEVKELHIGNFLPLANWGEVEYVSPFLLSMLTCKQKGGFRTEPREDNRGHGVVDTLLPHLSYYLLDNLLDRSGARLSVPFSILCQDPDCKDRRSRMDRENGFFNAKRDGTITSYVKFRPKYHTQTRAALSRYRNAAHESMLYTATALRPRIDSPRDKRKEVSLAFVGRVHGSNNKVDDLIQALNSTPIGSKRSIGYGRIGCKDGTVSLSPVEDRLEAFNTCLIDLWCDLKRLANSRYALQDRPDGFYFSIDLMAPAILRDKCGIPSLIPILQIEGEPLEPVFWMTRPDFAGGWSDAWGLPKMTALAARMGSSYVYRWDGPKDGLIDILERIEAEGVGERRDEGFGECLICHPFHQEVNEK